jgi:hypothetical protein
MTTYNLSLHNNYNLKNLYTFNNVSDNVSEDKIKICKDYNIKQRVFTYNNTDYGLINYNKSKLDVDNVYTSGLFRSVIHNEDKILSFSPPKSIEFELFKQQTNITNVDIEEYVEGTMINMFWNETEWIISTKNKIGAKTYYFTNNLQSPTQTFHDLFYDFVNSYDDFFDYFNNLPKNYSYTFVLQHIKNRIVTPFIYNKLYLVSIYETNEFCVNRVPLTDELKNNLPQYLSYPLKYECKTWDDITILVNYLFNSYKSFFKVGLFFTDRTRNIRSKIRNIYYEEIKKLRGNQPKLKYTYLQLRLNKNIKKYLNYYPEHKMMFDMYRDEITQFIKNLYVNYVKCYIKKENKLKKFDFEYRKFMYDLHQLYLNELKCNNKKINYYIVYNFFNKQHPSVIMFSLNYKYRDVVEQPVVEQPVVEQPVVEQPVVEQPVVEQPVVEQPVVEQPVVEQPVVDDHMDFELV